MDEARSFSSGALRDLLPSMDPHLKSKVAHSLELPLHWRAPRQEARWFIDHYAKDMNSDPLIAKFSKLDFNNVQNMHRQEIAKLTRYANLISNLDLAKKINKLVICNLQLVEGHCSWRKADICKGSFDRVLPLCEWHRVGSECGKVSGSDY